MLGWPLDRIIHAEVWATDDIPADPPPMVDFKAKADQIIKERWGIEVEHLCAMRNGEKLTYEKLFYHVPVRKTDKPNGGGNTGFPYQCGPWCNTKLKIRGMRLPVHNRELVQEAQRRVISSASLSSEGIGATAISNAGFSQCSLAQGAKINIVQYLGIAADEPERIARHRKPGFLLPLVEIGWEEDLCGLWCQYSDLLSPIYTTATRGGCWFCHNQGVDQLRVLRKTYPDLWAKLLQWDLDSPTTFKADGHTVHDYDLRFQAEDEGKVPADRKFRWKMLNIKEENIMAPKKTEETAQDYTGMNALQKLQIARVDFLNAGVKKTGKHIKLEYLYFELKDIVPAAEAIFAKVGLLMVPSFIGNTAIAKVYNVDDRNEDPIVFESPFVQNEPIVSNAGKEVTNPLQALGGSITYMRRYLWQLVLDIVEADTIDSGIYDTDDDPPAPAPKPTKKAPVTTEKRQEIKAEMTAPPANAAEGSKVDILKALLKNLLALDAEQESFVQSIAMKTEGFTKITDDVCDQLIEGVQQMIAAYEPQEG